MLPPVFKEKLIKYSGEMRPGECWVWTGQKTPLGYAALWHKQKRHRAHRIAWMLHHGKEIPPGMVICHSCDNPLCVNPEHLWIGTQADNIRDMIAKGRGNKIVQSVKAEFCIRGHARTPENLRGRSCRECLKMRKK